jgi:hypothetical protein
LDIQPVSPEWWEKWWEDSHRLLSVGNSFRASGAQSGVLRKSVGGEEDRQTLDWAWGKGQGRVDAITTAFHTTARMAM